MKQVSTETVIFEKVRYSCDVCHRDLLQGEKPQPCNICGVDTCQGCRSHVSIPRDDVLWACTPCLAYQSEFSLRWEHIFRLYTESVTALKAEWKQKEK